MPPPTRTLLNKSGQTIQWSTSTISSHWRMVLLTIHKPEARSLRSKHSSIKLSMNNHPCRLRCPIRKVINISSRRLWRTTINIPLWLQKGNPQLTLKLAIITKILQFKLKRLTLTMLNAVEIVWLLSVSSRQKKQGQRYNSQLKWLNTKSHSNRTRSRTISWLEDQSDTSNIQQELAQQICCLKYQTTTENVQNPIFLTILTHLSPTISLSKTKVA